MNARHLNLPSPYQRGRGRERGEEEGGPWVVVRDLTEGVQSAIHLRARYLNFCP